MKISTRWWLSLLLFLYIVQANAQKNNAHLFADWQRIDALQYSKLSELYDANTLSPYVVDGTNFVVFNQVEQGSSVYYLLDCATGNRQLLMSSTQDFIAQYIKLTGDTTLKANDLKLYNLTFSDAHANQFDWTCRSKQFVFDRKNMVLHLDTMQTARQKHVNNRTKSSGLKEGNALCTILGDRYNLFVRDNKTQKVKQLTFDGKEYASYCGRTAKDTLTEKNAAGRWFGNVYMCFVQDDSRVGNLYIINSLKKHRPALTTKKMPLPGEKEVRQYKLFWYHAKKDQAKLLDIYKFKDQWMSFSYGNDSTTAYFLRRNRGVDTIELCRIDIEKGEVKTLISETCKPHLNLTLFNYRIINNGHNILWWSERTGKGNYYLYDASGKLINRVTQGNDLVAGAIKHIDEKRGELIFAGYGLEKGFDPYYTFYYKAKLSGKKQQLLTKGNGTHDLTLAKGSRYAIDSYSRMDLPTVYQAVNIDNPKKTYKIVCRNDSALRQAGWTPPRLIKVKAADGTTDLYGLMYVPSHLDTTKKYPVISNVYPGPQDDQLPRAFTIDDNANQRLAELGFIVVNVAPRGSSPLRGKDFYCFGYGNLRDYPLADDKHVIETLARQYSFIDLDRVGIYGHSGGGFMAATAMLTYPGFYKVGVAASGNHDNNVYIQWWGETFHGITNKIPTNLSLAKNLQGNLLLVHGDVDDNVPITSTYRLAHALIENGKRFDMMVLPGKDHSVWSEYYHRLVHTYFLEHLVNPQKCNVDMLELP